MCARKQVASEGTLGALTCVDGGVLKAIRKAGTSIVVDGKKVITFHCQKEADEKDERGLLHRPPGEDVSGDRGGRKKA